MDFKSTACSTREQSEIFPKGVFNMKKWAKVAIVIMACLIIIWALAFLALAQDNGYSLQVALYSGGIVGIAVGIAFFLSSLIWFGVNWIMEG